MLIASEVARVRNRLLDDLTPDEEKFIVDLAGYFDTTMLSVSPHHSRSRFGAMSAIELTIAIVKQFGERLPDVIAQQR